MCVCVCVCVCVREGGRAGVDVIVNVDFDGGVSAGVSV